MQKIIFSQQDVSFTFFASFPDIALSYETFKHAALIHCDEI